MQKRILLGVAVGLASVATAILYHYRWIDLPVPYAYNGDSPGLRQTVILPTLNTPIPAGKNAIWCSSFQLAWNHAKDDVIHAPIKMESADSVLAMLNHTEQQDSDLLPNDYFVMAGQVKNGIVDDIQRKMGERFPGQSIPRFDSYTADDIIAYAYISSEARLSSPLDVQHTPLTFSDPSQHEVQVSSFGVQEHASEAQRRQLYVDYWKNGESVITINAEEGKEIVLACIEPKATLQDTIAAVESRIPSWTLVPRSKYELREEDTVVIPNMHWKILHHFQELEGKRILNTQFHNAKFVTAQQLIDFRIDHTGARVESKSQIGIYGLCDLMQPASSRG